MLHDELLYFFCIGVQKAGTTTLHDILARDHCISLPTSKETKFFADDSLWSRGYEYYDGLYRKPLASVRGEVDPDYIYIDRAVPRILERTPDARFIVIFRDPVSRAWSHYQMSLRRGAEDLSFAEAMHAETSRLLHGGWFSRLHHSYLDRGHFSRQLGRLRGLVGPDLLLPLLQEDLIDRPHATIAKVYHFLGLDAPEFAGIPQSNPGGVARSRLVARLTHRDGTHKTVAKAIFRRDGFVANFVRAIRRLNFKTSYSLQMDPELRRELIEIYEPDIAAVESLVGRMLPQWRATGHPDEPSTAGAEQDSVDAEKRFPIAD